MRIAERITNNTTTITQVTLLGGGACMDENQNCITALVEICKDFVKYLNTLKEKGFLSEAEFEKYTRTKRKFIEKMGK